MITIRYWQPETSEKKLVKKALNIILFIVDAFARSPLSDKLVDF